MVRCSVLECKSDSEMKLPDLSFHSFPVNDDLRMRWIEATGRPNWTPKKFSKLCSKHFAANDIFKKKKVTVLHPNAVPMLKSEKPIPSTSSLVEEPMEVKKEEEEDSNLTQFNSDADFNVSKEADEINIVNVYKHFLKTWPLNDCKRKRRICEETASILNTSLTKVWRVLKKKGINYSDDFQRPNTPIELDEDEIETSTCNVMQEPAENNQDGTTKEQETQTIQTLCPKISVRTNLLNEQIVGNDFLTKNNPPEDLTGDVTRKLEMFEYYECPMCNILYPKYINVVEHLQFYHSVGGINPESIEKVIVQQCVICNKTVKSLLFHQCLQGNLVCDASTYHCAICKKFFTTVEIENHMQVHGQAKETMYFPSYSDFLSWKEYIEAQSLVQYTKAEEHDNKQYYRCVYVNGSRAQICPGLMIAQEYGNGIHVDLFETHELMKKKYTLPAKYKKYYISKLFNPVEGYNATKVIMDGNDQYLKLKILLENIAVDAAKIDVNRLRVLMSKALEMASVLTSYDEEIENTDKQDNFAQIPNTLQDSDASAVKRPKFDTTPKIVNTFSLASVQIDSDSDNDSGTSRSVELKDVEMELFKTSTLCKNAEQYKCNRTIQTDILNSDNQTDTTKVTFNDTYKDFVTKQFDRDAPLPQYTIRRKKPPAKTIFEYINHGKMSENTNRDGDNDGSIGKGTVGTVYRVYSTTIS
ncbi:uncharacterized protein LOC123704592 isoform X1 [Colias croceus]|uniref:uncharacterized protein LOC123704592 isoform X1 n=1 Tax=Colias crocea TaxID=72248 RepID=UPI001E27F6E0|nr:uncharacterized protein LOC123704592 isoform X1 [Colias croceus]